jgi:hypothetical protein
LSLLTPWDTKQKEDNKGKSEYTTEDSRRRLQEEDAEERK